MIASQIKTLREDLGLGQVELAQLMGVHPITVSKWENGHADPSAYQLALLGQFHAAAQDRKIRETVKNVLIAAGVAVALALLLSHLLKKAK